MATATLEIDQTILQALQTQASNQGLSIDALLRKLTENGNGTENHLLNIYAVAQEPDTQETIGERLERKGLIGMIDSSQPRPDSPPNKSAIGDILAEKYRQQGLIIDAERKPTPYELVKDIIGAFDSSIPSSDPDAQPQHTPLGALVAEKLKSQGLKF
jgi:hypothetical protein